MTISIRNVIVAVNLADASWRDFITGMFAFARAKAHWNIRLLTRESEFTADVVRAMPKEGIDGVITGFHPSPDVLAAIVDSPVPIVQIGRPDARLAARSAKTTFICHDDEDIGRLGAEHFFSIGAFNIFGYVAMEPTRTFSEHRRLGFTKAVERHGEPLSVFRSRLAIGSADDIHRLSRWLAELPKPAAVMAAYDGRAMHVLEACKHAKLKVPEQVAVLGVDNDRLLCDFSDPPLSSIAPNHEKEGWTAGEELDRLMSGRERKRTKSVFITDKRIAERDSARTTSPTASLIRRATDYISRNAGRNFKVADVADYLGVSRSLLDLRFREARGETVAATIAKMRLDEVRRRLRKTSASIRTISRECGFANPNHLKNLFKRHFGISMREYRNSQQAAATAYR